MILAEKNAHKDTMKVKRKEAYKKVIGMTPNLQFQNSLNKL